MLGFLLGRGKREFEAQLSGVDGFTGYGEIEFSARGQDWREMEVELRGVAGRAAEIFFGGSRVTPIAIVEGRADQRFSTRSGHGLPEIHAGDEIEVRQNGDVILRGVFRPD